MEEIPIPNELRDYSLTVRDSRGDGIGNTNYTLSFNDLVLVVNEFETGGANTNDFSLDPSIGDTAAPTVSPTTPNPAATPTPVTSPTNAPDDGNSDRGSDGSSASTVANLANLLVLVCVGAISLLL